MIDETTPYLTDTVSRRFSLGQPVTLLGRSPHCEIVIAEPRASRRHAEIRWDGQVSTLSDLESANGTFLNGRRITGTETLRNGDEISVASAVFIFHDPESTLRASKLPLLVVDAKSGEIWVNRKSVSLSRKEHALFNLLYCNIDTPVDKQQIAEAIWPEYQAEVFDYQIESLVKRLREKLEPDPHTPVLILTVPSRGYKLANG